MEPTDTRIITDLAQLVGMELDDRYALKAVLGEGAMGVVFRATQLSIQRDVAIKVLKLGTFRDDASLDRFRREMEIISGLTHPNVVRLLDSGVDDRMGVFYLAMEFIEGVTLGDMLYEVPRRVRPELALEIVYQVCAGLTEPHREGIVHRDIKPDNILIQIASDDTVRIKVVDFGIAKAAADDQRVTATGVIVGTPSYMAPELCRATGDLDARTDLYALGVLLYELLTGFVPFQADTSLAVMLKQVSEPPPPLSAHLDDELESQDEIQRLLDELLNKDPAKRPESAREVRRRIDAIRDAAGMARVRVDSSRAWAQALSPYMVRTARLPTWEEYAVRTTMIMARHTTEEVQPIVTAMAQRSRAERRATFPEPPPNMAAATARNVPAADQEVEFEDITRGRTELHIDVGQDTHRLVLWMAGIAACIAVLGVVAYRLSATSSQEVVLSPPAQGGTEVAPREVDSHELAVDDVAASASTDAGADAGAVADGSGQAPEADPKVEGGSDRPKKVTRRVSRRKKTDAAKGGGAPDARKPDVKEDPPRNKDPPATKTPRVEDDPPVKKDPPEKDPPRNKEGIEWLNN